MHVNESNLWIDGVREMCTSVLQKRNKRREDLANTRIWLVVNTNLPEAVAVGKNADDVTVLWFGEYVGQVAVHLTPWWWPQTVIELVS